MPSYYERRRQSDGRFSNAEDAAHEREVAALIEKAWNCRLGSFGSLAPIDWYAVRGEKVEAIIELKCRSHSFGTYDTVYLPFRKWLSMTHACIGLQVPGVFVVRFVDGDVYWVPLDEIDPSNSTKVAGCLRTVKAVSDIAPIVHVPIQLLRRLCPSTSAQEPQGLEAPGAAS